MYYLQVTVTLNMNYELVFRIIISVANLLYILRSEFPIYGVCLHLGTEECPFSFWGHCDLDL